MRDGDRGRDTGAREGKKNEKRRHAPARQTDIRRREVQRTRRGSGPAWRMAQVTASLCPSQIYASLCPRSGPGSVRHGWSAEEGENAGLEGDRGRTK